MGTWIGLAMFVASVSPIAMAQREIIKIIEHEPRDYDMNTRLSVWNVLGFMFFGVSVTYSLSVLVGPR